MTARAGGSGSARWVQAVLLALAAAMWLLCFVHLGADFPNGSPWRDWAKMTDEGWYAGGAVHESAYGRWVLEGSFNPAVAMPVWSAMVWAWFHLVGAGMVSARVLTVLVYGASLLLLYGVVRRVSCGLAAACAVLLMAVNPFAYAFDRLAVLEPVLVLWLMLGLWLGGAVGRRDGLRLALVGAAMCLLVLTKPTGLFLVPAVLYQVGATRGRWLRPSLHAGLSAVALWLLYYAVVVHPHLAADYRLLFSINRDRVHLSIVPRVALETLRDGLWMGAVVYAVALAGVLAALLWLRELWRIPLFLASVAGVAGYLAFIGYHSNLQPRYYLVIAMPVAMVAVLVLETVARRTPKPVSLGLMAVVAASALGMATRTLGYVVRPEYSFAGAARDMGAKMRAEEPRPLLLSNSGDDVTLWTGVPAVTVEYGTVGLDAVMARYRPGWYAMWPGREDRWKAQVEARYALEERARYTVFDDPERQTLVLYRMVPRPTPGRAAP